MNTAIGIDTAQDFQRVEDGWPYAPEYATREEHDWLGNGSIKSDSSQWNVETPDGAVWQVWRGWSDDAHERLYRSPEGQYYLGTVKSPDNYIAPYESLSIWEHPIGEVASPMTLRHWSRIYRGPQQQSVTQMGFMRVVAAAWFLDRDQGDGTHTDRDCPQELRRIALSVLAMRAAVDAMETIDYLLSREAGLDERKLPGEAWNGVGATGSGNAPSPAN